MRQLATIDDEGPARALADYLLTLQIETRVDPQSGKWDLWVLDEDRLPQARQEMAAYLANPSDARYADAARRAEEQRREVARSEREASRRQVDLGANLRTPGLAGGAPLTFTLIAFSVAVAFNSNFGRNVHGDLMQSLFIRPWPAIDQEELFSPRLTEVAHGQFWRLVTPIFIHFSIQHLFFNMLGLLYFGSQIERRRGTVALSLLVLGLAVTSNLAQFFYGDLSFRAGARFVANPDFGGMSGVIYGLFGYALIKSHFEPALGIVNPTQTVVLFFIWYFYCLSGWAGPVANTAHTVGFVFGLAVGYVPVAWKSLRR